MRRLHPHKRTICLTSNNGTAAQCYQLCFMYTGMLWLDIGQHIESTNVCAILLQTWGKHFLKADTVRKKEIQGRMARKLKQLLLLSREFLFCHSAKKSCQKTDPFIKYEKTENTGGKITYWQFCMLYHDRLMCFHASGIKAMTITQSRNKYFVLWSLLLLKVKKFLKLNN